MNMAFSFPSFPAILRPQSQLAISSLDWSVPFWLIICIYFSFVLLLILAGHQFIIFALFVHLLSPSSGSHFIRTNPSIPAKLLQRNWNLFRREKALNMLALIRLKKCHIWLVKAKKLKNDPFF
jgi:hypothetical protein